MILPNDFIDELKIVLGDDTDKYITLFEEAPFRGISVNRLKTTPEQLFSMLPFEPEQSPFYSDSFYLPENAENIGQMPLHHAGAFYVQEPSAASAVSLLDIHNGDIVLDLCAAPGGKTSQIASMLGGSGLIWSNEVVKSRASILLSNSERMGIAHGVISSCDPEVLCSRLSGYFDKVLVDAPCSGEGMFRKNHSAISEWSREHALACADRQLAILDSAAKALKCGGTMVYSTCTFNYDENEGVVKRFLECHGDFEPLEISHTAARKAFVGNGIRITPVEGGEGHFAAVFRKNGDSDTNIKYYKYPLINKEQKKLVQKFIEDIFVVSPELVPVIIGDKLYLMPDGLPDMGRLGVIRSGIFAGTVTKNRIDPEHALFSCAKPEQLCRVLDLPPDDQRISDFLRGFEIDCDGSGYTGVAVGGIMLGFGKCSGGRLKNKYPKGLRKNS